MRVFVRGIGAFLFVSAMAGCLDEQPKLTPEEATTVWWDAEEAAWNAQDNATGVTLAAKVNATMPCMVDGDARVIGGYGDATRVASFDVAFHSCDEYDHLVGGHVRTTQTDVNDIAILSITGSVEVHDDQLGAKLSDGASCDLDVHSVIETIPEGDLFTYHGTACGLDVATFGLDSLVPPSPPAP